MTTALQQSHTEQFGELRPWDKPKEVTTRRITGAGKMAKTFKPGARSSHWFEQCYNLTTPMTTSVRQPLTDQLLESNKTHPALC